MNSASQIQPGAADAGLERVASISVIFPALNEEGNIRRTVEQACGTLSTLAEKWEIIIVNDGSRDATQRICDELAEANPGVTRIHHPNNRGYGAALKSGIAAAQHGLIFFSDSDGQFDIAELRSLVIWSKNFEIVAGYRARRNDPPHRLFNAWGWRLLVRLALGIKVRDIDCSFKLFRREVFNHVQISSVGSMVNTQILAQAMRLGMRIHEVPVTHFPRRYGKPTGAELGVIVKALSELVRMWWKLRNISPDQTGLYSDKTGEDKAGVDASVR